MLLFNNCFLHKECSYVYLISERYQWKVFAPVSAILGLLVVVEGIIILKLFMRKSNWRIQRERSRAFEMAQI